MKDMAFTLYITTQAKRVFINFSMLLIEKNNWLQTTQPTSGGAVTADPSCCANCVETPHPQQWVSDLPFLGMPAMRTRWMAGAAAHKSR